jgi:alpha-glucuronidase
MKLDGYEVVNITPWETASVGKAVQCVSPSRHGSVSFRYGGKPGWFDLGVQYFDEDNGLSQFKVFVAGQMVDTWKAGDVLPTPTGRPTGRSPSRRSITGWALRPGDEIRIEGTANGGENACIDYVEIEPSGD